MPPAMRLMLLRHAKSEKAEPGMRDHERRSMRAAATMRRAIGAYMARHGLVPDRALVSTAQRTRETWERLAAALAGRAAGASTRIASTMRAPRPSSRW